MAFYYIGKELDATIVHTKIDYKNRRFELMEEYLLRSVENDKNALMDVYHMVQGRNKTWIFKIVLIKMLLVIFLVIFFDSIDYLVGGTWLQEVYLAVFKEITILHEQIKLGS